MIKSLKNNLLTYQLVGKMAAMNTTYTNILQLADKLIQSNGFHGFSYADLAKELDIRKASIHHHFATKADLGIAFCQLKCEQLQQLESHLKTLPSAKERLKGYFDVFQSCASEKQMCGIYAMQTDLRLMAEPLQKQVTKMADLELQILSSILQAGLERNEFSFKTSAYQQAVIICCAIKGALMLNRSEHHQGIFIQTCDACLETLSL
ncbi:TetR/AcrR family transcriptional regulator [Pseudoalteromonas arabiensis]|uniref:TetR/AcrR family transcriptional regulator n=1 Tax=Pseudoalteromonas arabiensis TaxID=874454 RepID=UPI000785C1F6|nr:TetR/AcrR family transcriptional regulator [Pseudoalteromonas arabiensis]